MSGLRSAVSFHALLSRLAHFTAHSRHLASRRPRLTAHRSVNRLQPTEYIGYTLHIAHRLTAAFRVISTHHRTRLTSMITIGTGPLMHDKKLSPWGIPQI